MVKYEDAGCFSACIRSLCKDNKWFEIMLCATCLWTIPFTEQCCSFIVLNVAEAAFPPKIHSQFEMPSIETM